jgi:hypothetical protein
MSPLPRRRLLALAAIAGHGAWAAAAPVPPEVMRALVARGAGAPPATRAAAAAPELLAKAAPDECYDGIGNPYPPGPPCAQGRPKVNQAYVWGLAKDGRQLWFGTAPNVHCLVMGLYLGQTAPVETSSYVCEFGASPYAPPLPDFIGDWRPPHIYLHDLASGALVEKTPADPRVGLTVGLRSAGTHGGVVFLAGPAFTGGINLFAFRTDTGDYLGSSNLPSSNIRKWLVWDDVLYTAAGTKVLRWRGGVADPFRFDEVGVITGDGVELAVHEGRLFVSTWPPGVSSLFMSPLIPAGGLTTAHAGGWSKVWDAASYEPDPVTASTYGGGALHSYGGWLYFGTMHVPFVAAAAHFAAYGTPSDPAQLLAAYLGTHRAIAIFRGRDFATAPSVELLYGEAQLQAYDAVAGWRSMANGTGPPRFGPSGFGNFFNNYTWTMDAWDGDLYVGTMDWSYLAGDQLGLPPGVLPYGADLYRFDGTADPAVAVSTDGLGNYANYGIRTMLADDALYLGTANPMNLMTDLADQLPEGGWELWRWREAAPSYVVGPGPAPGNPNLVRVYAASAVLRREWAAYGAASHGTRVAAGDVDGLSPEILTGPGPGAVYGPHVRAFRYDATAIARISFYAFGTLRFGVNVASGDVDGVPPGEILAGAGPGAVFGPHVRGFRFDGAAVAPVAGLGFYGYHTLRYGVEVAGADVDGDGTADMLTGPGPGPVFAPQVRGFRYAGSGIAPIATINAVVFPDPTHGCRVGAGDLDGDGAAEGLFGPGPGPALPPRLRGFELQGGPMAPLPGCDTVAWPALSFGAGTAGGDLDADGVDEALACQGFDPAATSRLRGFSYDGTALLPLATSDFDTFPGLSRGTHAALDALPF